MADDREQWSDEDGALESEYDGDSLGSGELVSEEAFDAALDALEAAGPDEVDEFDEADWPAELEAVEPVEPTGEDLLPEESSSAEEERAYGHDVAPVGESERLRQPRAQTFRRRLQMQVGTLPLALFAIALGVYLIARERDVRDLPDYSALTLGVAAFLVVGFTFVFHAIVFGRRERGLLFLGFWMLLTAGTVAVVMLGIEADPKADEWWPLLLVSMGLALVATYLLERLHDARLLVLGVMVLIASAIALLVTQGEIEQDVLDTVADYWPLLFSVIGIGLLPLVFGRRVGSS